MEQLCYLDNVYYDIPGFDNTYKIHRAKDFQWSDMNSHKHMHISLKNIYYPIDWTKLGMTTIAFPVALRFDDYNDIKPIFNRESIQYNAATIKAIKAKIIAVADWFVDKWNAEMTEYDTLRDARWTILHGAREVTVDGKKIDIKPILNLATNPDSDVKVKGISLRPPKFYANLNTALIEDFTFDGFDYNGTWRKAHADHYRDRALNDQKTTSTRVVLVNETISGYVKDYLREKYNSRQGQVVYLKYNPVKREMARSAGLHYDESWQSILSLDTIPRTQWQAYIDEYKGVVAQYKDSFYHELDVRGSKDFEEWLERRKAAIKAGAKVPNRSSFVPLQKEQGEITIYRGRTHKVIFNEIAYDKTKERIEDLYKIGKQSNAARIKPTIYWTTSEENIHNLIVLFYMEQFQFVKVNPTEEKHVKQINHFIHKDVFMKSKPLARLATAIKIDEILSNDPPNIEIAEDTFNRLKVLRKKLRDYRDTHYVSNSSSRSLTGPIKRAIVDDAEERGAWDRDIYPDIVLYQKEMKPFQFLSVFKDINGYGYDSTRTRILKNTIYIMVKYQKINNKMVQDMMLVEVPPEKPASDEEEEFEIEKVRIA